MLFIQFSVSVFFAIVFIQSGIDKIFNWKDNLNWLKQYFEKSPLKNQVPLLLGITTVLESGAGFLSVIGSFLLLAVGDGYISKLGLVFSNLSLLCLFFGQRLAKDYTGAAGLVPYFILSLLGLYFLS
jgi:hypothetical protein